MLCLCSEINAWANLKSTKMTPKIDQNHLNAMPVQRNEGLG